MRTEGKKTLAANTGSRLLAMLWLLLFAGMAQPLIANPFTWEGTVNNNWFEPDNWNPAAVPGLNADVIADGTILLTNETAELASFTMTGGTMTFSNWTTRLRAQTVDLQDGTLTLPEAFEEGAMSNRVWIVADDVTVGENATIDADFRGYARENGPGRGTGGGSYGPGGGYGGIGGFSQGGAPGGQTYGSISAPTNPGSGGGDGNNIAGHGGGAVRIDATIGTVTVFGTITANGQRRNSHHAGSGSGGAVFITCSRFEGSPNGLIRVNGGTSSSGGGPGGGGRIAVVYDPLVQNGFNPGVRFQAMYGTGGYSWSNPGRNAEDGTLFLPDTSFLSDTLDGQFLGVKLHGPLDWSPTVLSAQNTRLIFAEEGFDLQVAGDLLIGADATLGIGPHGQITCNNLTLSDGGDLYMYAGATNGVSTTYGALLTVTGTGQIGAGSWIYPDSDIDNGGSPLMQFGNLTIAEGGGINANYRGWGNFRGPGGGSGSTLGGGAGYGGEGGLNDYGSGAGPAYGSRDVPALPGSGGGHNWGGRGGGLIWLEINGSFTLQGSLLANGRSGINTHGGGGSGGGIYVTCDALTTAPETRIEARGGNLNNRGGGGGGGRVALWIEIHETIRPRLLAGQNVIMHYQDESHPEYQGHPVDVSGGSPTTSRAGEPGTIRWFWSELVHGSLIRVN